MNTVYRHSASSWPALTVSFLLLLCSCNRSTSQTGELASLQDLSLSIHPVRMTLLIPSDWSEWYHESGNNIHLTSASLAGLATAEGEWDKEYTEVLNSILPISACVAHLGGEGWGREAVSCADLQMRVYVGNFSPEQTELRIHDKGMAKARAIGHRAVATNDMHHAWHVGKIQYDVWYGDYGGTAHIDLFSQAIKTQTVTIAFMYAEPFQSKALLEIVDSASVTQ